MERRFVLGAGDGFYCQRGTPHAARATDSTVGGRPGLIYRCEEKEGHIKLSCHGSEIVLPDHAGTALRYALSTSRFVIADLPGELDDAGKLVLVRRLVREGLVLSYPTGSIG